MKIEQLRSDPLMREDFLRMLARRCFNDIILVSKQVAGLHATADLIRNEATQAFLVAANAAIDSYVHQTGGIVAEWCKLRGLGGVRTFLRQEFGTRKRFKKRYAFNQRVVYAQDLYPPNANLANPLDRIFVDSRNYEAQVDSMLDLQALLQSLPPIDRSIVELLVFGEDDFGTMRVASRWGSPKHHTAADVGLTIGMSHQFVYKRLAAIRTALAPKLEVLA